MDSNAFFMERFPQNRDLKPLTSASGTASYILTVLKR
jgi:hypothetical protein